MELTNNAQSKFLEYFHREGYSEYDAIENIMRDGQPFDAFRTLPDNMKYGVYQLFANEQGVQMYVSPLGNDWGYSVITKKEGFRGNKTGSIEFAMNENVKKLNEILNEL